MVRGEEGLRKPFCVVSRGGFVKIRLPFQFCSFSGPASTQLVSDMNSIVVLGAPHAGRKYLIQSAFARTSLVSLASSLPCPHFYFHRRSLHWRAELVGLAPAGVDDRAGATLSLHTKYYSAECRIVSLPLPLPAEVEADAVAWFEANAPVCQAVIAVFDLADVCAAAIEW